MMFDDWSLHHALLFNVAISVLYIAPLYCIPQHIRDLSRDHDTNIKCRMVIVCLSTTASVLLFLLLVPSTKYLLVSPFIALGFCPPSWPSLLHSLGITSLLMTVFYSGPIVAACHVVAMVYSERGGQVSFAKLLYSFIMSSYRDESIWRVVRALVVAPISEEVVFRSVMVASMATGLRGAVTQGAAAVVVDPSSSMWLVVCLNPLCFGLAHVHHCIEKVERGWDLLSAVASTLVQFTYTSIFGCIATLLFMRTGSIYSAIWSHVICNYAGLPDTGFMYPPRSSSGDRHHLFSYSRLLYPYRFMHVGLHALGLVLFAVLIMPATVTTTSSSSTTASIHWTTLPPK